MSDDITKLCADSLRAFLQSNYGITLKSSHSHELVASFVGYHSRAALLADTEHPLSNLRHASFVVLAPTAPIDDRRQSLEGLSPELPDTHILSEGVYSALISENWLLSKPWPTFELLACFLADEYLRQQRIENIYRRPVGEGVKVEREDGGVQMTVSRYYQLITGPAQVQSVDVITTINLTRVAGHIGYSEPRVSAKIEMLGARA